MRSVNALKLVYESISIKKNLCYVNVCVSMSEKLLVAL